MRIAICEDKQEDTKRLTELLTRYLELHRIDADVDYFISGEDFLSAFEPDKYHIVFMDIRLKDNGITGVDVAEIISRANRDIAVIFTTVSREYSFVGYKFAEYYLVKPFDENEFDIAMGLCWKQIEQFAKTIEIIVDRQPVNLRIRDIYSIESLGRTCVFTTEKGNITASNLMIEGLVEKLGGFPFVRCHRAYIVNLVYVQAIKENEFLLKNDTRILISRSYQNASRRAATDYVLRSAQGETI